jgi:hypothetical protein
VIQLLPGKNFDIRAFMKFKRYKKIKTKRQGLRQSLKIPCIFIHFGGVPGAEYFPNAYTFACKGISYKLHDTGYFILTVNPD